MLSKLEVKGRVSGKPHKPPTCEPSLYYGFVRSVGPCRARPASALFVLVRLDHVPDSRLAPLINQLLRVGGYRQRRSGEGRGRESAVRKHARWGESNRPSRPSPATSFSPRARGHVLVLDYIDSRAEALEQDILWISASGAARCRRASAVQVREGVHSLREDVVVTLPVTMEILSVRAVKTSCLSRALPPECWSHHSLVFSLQAGARGELAWRCQKNGFVAECEFRSAFSISR